MRLAGRIFILQISLVWYNSYMVLWRSGYAAVCKTAYTGSIPVGTSIFFVAFHTKNNLKYCF